LAYHMRAGTPMQRGLPVQAYSHAIWLAAALPRLVLPDTTLGAPYYSRELMVLHE
jgi:hypothetical protein